MSSTRSAAFHLTWFHTRQQSDHRFGTSASPGHLHLQGLASLFEMHSNNAPHPPIPPPPSPLPYSLHPSIQCTFLPALKQPNVTSGCEASKLLFAPMKASPDDARLQITCQQGAWRPPSQDTVSQLLHENGLAFDPLVLGLHRGIRTFFFFFLMSEFLLITGDSESYNTWAVTSTLTEAFLASQTWRCADNPEPLCRCLAAKCGIVAQVDLYLLTNFYHRAKKTCQGLPEASR